VKVPHDPALPRLDALLDPDAMAPVLERSLGEPARVDALRIARVSYKPGERAIVHYEVLVEGRAENAVARAVAGHDLAAKPRKKPLVLLAERVNGRSPAATPLLYDAEVDALLTWLPLDPRLPALAEFAGARLLAYKPGRRAVLRLGSHVLKVYGSVGQFAAVSAHVRLAPALGLTTPRCEAVFEPLRLTVHAPLDGAAVEGLEAAAEAGALVRALQEADDPGLAPAPRGDQLAAARRKADLLATVVPALRPRLEALARRLARSEPPAQRLVPAHGDFHARQLVRTGETLHVVDLDSLGLASPGLDLAEYAAAETDPSTVLDALLEGYGARPEDLEWDLATALLVHASHPFHRALPEWESRTEALVAAAEEAAP
jgi:hypothetical protein